MNATKSHVASLLNMDGKVTGRSIAYAAVMVGLLLLVIYSLQVGYSLYLTYRMRRSGSKYIAVSAMSVSTTSLSTTSKRKTMPPRSSELKNFLHGGISEYWACLDVTTLMTSHCSQVFPHHAIATIDSNDSRNKLKAQRACAAEMLK